MAKRYKRINNDNGLAILVLMGLVGIWSAVIGVITFIQQNSIIILIILGIILFIILFFMIFSIIRKKKNLNKIIEEYKNTPYFIDTKLPFSDLPKDRGTLFEIEIYDRLKSEFKNDIQIIHNLLIPKINAVNEYSEIDLIAIHFSGIYVIEVKNYSGPVTGKDEDEYWKPYVQDVDNNNQQSYKQNFAIKGFSQYGLYNPIKQNEGHIQSLVALVPNSYINKVIFSDTMLIGPSMHPKIFSMSGFVDFLKKTTSQKYNAYDLTKIKESILKVKVTDPGALSLHKARLSRK
jgi:hypothetical protein